MLSFHGDGGFCVYYMVPGTIPFVTADGISCLYVLSPQIVSMDVDSESIVQQANQPFAYLLIR